MTFEHWRDLTPCIIPPPEGSQCASLVSTGLIIPGDVLRVYRIIGCNVICLYQGAFGQVFKPNELAMLPEGRYDGR